MKHKGYLGLLFPVRSVFHEELTLPSVIELWYIRI
jgi:hypothetical protein